MCSRFTIATTDKARVQTVFPGVNLKDFRGGRFNIAPTQEVAAILDDSRDRISTLRWGLIPRWAKDPSIGRRMVNARAETLAEKPAFRDSLARMRCVIIADGFYEWSGKSGKQTGQAYYIHRRDSDPFAMAGLWSAWMDSNGAALRTCTVITTAPNKTVARIHDRMPVLLSGAAWTRWLDQSVAWQDVLRACPDDELVADPVSSRVNHPRNDDARCLSPEGLLFEL